MPPDSCKTADRTDNSLHQQKNLSKAMGFLDIELVEKREKSQPNKPKQPTSNYQKNIHGFSHPDLNWSVFER